VHLCLCCCSRLVGLLCWVGSPLGRCCVHQLQVVRMKLQLQRLYVKHLHRVKGSMQLVLLERLQEEQWLRHGCRTPDKILQREAIGVGSLDKKQRLVPHIEGKISLCSEGWYGNLYKIHHRPP